MYELSRLEEILGYSFKDKELLKTAVTHSSAMAEGLRPQCNERLEFLGDAVLQLIVTTALYQGYPDRGEGVMTQARASVVSGASLAKVARRLGLSQFLVLGAGASNGDISGKKSVLADATEAIIAAIYLDGGYEHAQEFVLRFLSEAIHEGATVSKASSKTQLQEYLQRGGSVEIKYAAEGASGPAHDRVFTEAVFLDGRKLAVGEGKSRKAAQEQAAQLALQQLKDNSEQRR